LSDINLVLTSPHITGPVVTQFQTDMNTRLRAWDIPYQVDVDGDYGQDTRDTARSILYGLGVDLSNEDFDGVSSTDRLKVRYGWDKLTPEEQVRQQDRAGWRHRLALRYGGGSINEALKWAAAQINTTESPAGSNRGPKIDAWNRAVGTPPGPFAYWCGAFANAVLVAGGFPDQYWLRYCPWIEAHAQGHLDGWAWIPVGGDVRKGDLVLYDEKGIAGHVGVVETVVNNRDASTVEGNTGSGPGGSQSNGGGVFRRHRHTDGSLTGFRIRGYARPPWS
jgi:hypothetical protein